MPAPAGAPRGAPPAADGGFSVCSTLSPLLSFTNDFQNLAKSAAQGLAIFVGVQWAIGRFSGKASTETVKDASGAVINVPANTAAIPPFVARPDVLPDGVQYSAVPQRIAPIWAVDSPLDITIVVSPSFVAVPLAKVPKERIVVDEMSFVLGNYDEKRVIDTEFTVPKEVQNNGTIWAHFYIGLTGSKLDPSTPGYDPARAFHFMHPLTHYLGQKRVKKTKNLLSSTPEDEVGILHKDISRGRQY